MTFKLPGNISETECSIHRESSFAIVQYLCSEPHDTYLYRKNKEICNIWLMCPKQVWHYCLLPFQNIWILLYSSLRYQSSQISPLVSRDISKSPFSLQVNWSYFRVLSQVSDLSLCVTSIGENCLEFFKSGSVGCDLSQDLNTNLLVSGNVSKRKSQLLTALNSKYLTVTYLTLRWRESHEKKYLAQGHNAMNHTGIEPISLGSHV